MRLTYVWVCRYRASLNHWNECLAFTATCCPPHDEAQISQSVHAMLAALSAEDRGTALVHAQTAACSHQVALPRDGSDLSHDICFGATHELLLRPRWPSVEVTLCLKRGTGQRSLCTRRTWPSRRKCGNYWKLHFVRNNYGSAPVSLVHAAR